MHQIMYALMAAGEASDFVDLEKVHATEINFLLILGYKWNCNG